MKKSTAVIASLFAVATAWPIASHAWQSLNMGDCITNNLGEKVCWDKLIRFHPPRGKYGYYDIKTITRYPNGEGETRAKTSELKVDCEEWKSKFINSYSSSTWDDIRRGSNGDTWAEIACARD